MRKRLEELSLPAQPHWLNNGDNGETAEVFDSKPCEVAVSPRISLVERVKKAG
jgi:hypothetical protein